MVRVPSVDQLQDAAERFDDDWGGVDEVLYGLCRAYPGHAVRRDVICKVALINRAYSAGLERQVRPDSGDQAIAKIADFMLAHSVEVDDIIAVLDSLREPLDASAMAVIVAQHGRLTTLLRQVTRKQTAPRSFASKYLHFH